MVNWTDVEALFQEAADMAPEDRRPWLRERSGGDEDLVQRVLALVAADARPAGHLERSVRELLLGLRREPAPEELCGATFGPFRVESHLSSGGSAHVYRAVRSVEGTERRVALKVLRPSMGSHALIERFRTERKTLAALAHEHIVAFVDAGVLPDGRPYFAMEYVDGVPLTTWSERAPLRTRLEVFLEVLAAVQFAHRQLVVHRDLKPSNVLVNARNVPYLLDFGVADDASCDGASCDDTSRDGVPGDGARGPGPMTPSYASPEQRRGEGITTASDIYSLGVLLHEVVTGDLPDREGPVAHSALDRDLESVVAKALAPIAADRYSSADDFAADLRRYLDGHPVHARTSTWSYRSLRFLRRNPWPISLGVATLAALVLGWIGSDLSRRAARAEARAGWGAHMQAKAVAHIFEEWIRSATLDDPALGAAALAHLERGIEEQLGDLPESETLVRLTLAQLHLDRGNRDRARVHAERAWELAQVTRGVGARERERAERLRADLARDVEPPGPVRDP